MLIKNDKRKLFFMRPTQLETLVWWLNYIIDMLCQVILEMIEL